MTKNIWTKILILPIAVLAVSCGNYYEDQILPPSDQELADIKEIEPRSGALKSGIFHMQRIDDGPSVLLGDDIQLKRPDLPPFDVVYRERNVESIILELANVAGESIFIPQGLRGRTITLVHSGADFQEMLDIVLGKVGYHYNYINGVWNITRYPIRSYTLEIGQSNRKGSLLSSAELSPEESEDGGSSSVSGMQLDTDYTDQTWEQVEAGIIELIQVGKLETITPSGGNNSSLNNSPTSGGSSISRDSGVELLPPPTLEGTEDTEALFGTLTSDGNIRPMEITLPQTTDHLQPEEDASPWYKITRSVGLITVRAAPEAHRMIETYLKQVQEAATRQVYIEVRIVAVIRDRTTDSGSTLTSTTDFGNTVLGTIGFQASDAFTNSNVTGGFINAYSQKTGSDKDMTIILQALSGLGDVYTISSPSMIARNNQLSRVSVTKQLGYIETEVEQNTTSAGDIIVGSRKDTAKFKNSGTVLSVFPFIGKSKVQLRLRLSVASKSGDTPLTMVIGSGATQETITTLVPELSNNVIDQDMVLDYGRVYAIGGLIESSTNIDKDYMPALSLVPGLSEILQRANNSKLDTEFIVLVRIGRA